MEPENRVSKQATTTVIVIFGASDVLLEVFKWVIIVLRRKTGMLKQLLLGCVGSKGFFERCFCDFDCIESM